MDTSYIISQLENNKRVFQDLLMPVSRDQVLWRNLPGKWNLLEIICHLYDEERDDFRSRLMHVLESPDKPLPAIDPVGWVLSRNYASKDYFSMLEDFLEERKVSVEWLKSLSNPPLNNAFMHPKFGPLSGNMFLANWLAHDYLHFRQIVKVKYDFMAFTSGQKLDYAGTW